MTDYESPEFRAAVGALVQPSLDEMADKIAKQAVSRVMLDEVLTGMCEQINAANSELRERLTDLRANGVDIKLIAAPIEAPKPVRTVRSVETDDQGFIKRIVDEPVEIDE